MMDKRKYLIIYGLIFLASVTLLIELFGINVDKSVIDLLINFAILWVTLSVLWFIESPNNLKQLLASIHFHEIIFKGVLVSNYIHPHIFFSLKDYDINSVIKDKSILVTDFYLMNNGDLILGIISRNKMKSSYNIKVENKIYNIRYIKPALTEYNNSGDLYYNFCYVEMYKSGDVFKLEESIINKNNIKIELSVYV